MGERLNRTQEVEGSIPFSSTIFFLAGAIVFAACSKPASEIPKSATISGKPTPDVLLAPTVVAEAPSPPPTEPPHSTEVVVSLRPPTPVPTFDVASIPSADRPREPEPRSTRDRLARCLTFSLSKTDMGPITGRHVVRVEVHARNSCSDVTFTGAEASFEVRVRDRTGKILMSQPGNFQAPIGPVGEGVTYVDVLATIDDRLEASVY